MAIELMVTDCLLAANQELRISDYADRAEDFVYLDDTILKVELCGWQRTRTGFGG